MKKVFGVSFVRVENGNFNAGFDGLARTDFEGNFFATDKARKYSLRQDFFNNQKEVLIRKHKTKDGKFESLKGIIESYGLSLKDEKLAQKIFNRFIDVRIFGAIINQEKNNILVTTGPCQFLFAKNQFVKDGERMSLQETIDITSFKSGSKDKAEAMTTIGKQTRVEKAYYMYPFVVNPNIYLNNAKEILGIDYDEEKIKNLYNEDVNVLKESIQYDVSELNSCTKMGCTNFVNIVITMKDEYSNINLATIQDNMFIEEKINIENSNIEVSINVENLYSDLLHKKDKIEKIEIYIPETKRFVIFGLEKLETLGIEIITTRN